MLLQHTLCCIVYALTRNSIQVKNDNGRPVFTIENEKYNGYYLNKFDQDDKDVDTRSFDDANNQNDTHWYIEPVFDEVELLWREIFAYDNRASSEPTDITWVTYTTGIKSSDQFSTTNAMTVSRFNSLNVY